MFAFFYSFQFSLLEIKEVNQHAAYTLCFLVIDSKGINIKKIFCKTYYIEWSKGPHCKVKFISNLKLCPTK